MSNTDSPLTLVLSFPSLVHFLSSSSHLPAIKSAAHRSSNLIIQVRTPPTLSASPWSSLLRRNGPSASSSSSSASGAPPPPPPPPPPVQLWLPLERALAQCYSTATAVFLETGRVLATVDVVIDEMRGLPLCTPSDQIERWTWTRAEDDGELGWGDAEESVSEKGIYDVAALGGTFDHLHAGHKILLTMACAITQVKLIVGVSGAFLRFLRRGILTHPFPFLRRLPPGQQKVPRPSRAHTATDSNGTAVRRACTTEHPARSCADNGSSSHSRLEHATDLSHSVSGRLRPDSARSHHRSSHRF